MKELKPGMKLYELDYFGASLVPHREVTIYIIKGVGKKTVSMVGYQWRIKIEEIGKTYFTSREAMYKDAMNRHITEREKIQDKLSIINTEIRYLRQRKKYSKVRGL